MDQRTVHLYVFDTLADWEPGYAIAGLNNPEFQANPGRYAVKTVGAGKEPVTTIGGVTILPDTTLSEVDPVGSALLILPGGAGWGDGTHVDALEKARAFLAASVPVAAICGATEGLARAGLLDDTPHTSNAADYLKATGYRGERWYRDEPAVTGGNVITAGSTAPLDFAYHVFRKLDVYDEPTLEAWYGLFKTGDPSYYGALQGEAATADP